MSFGLKTYGLDSLAANGIIDPMTATYGVSPLDAPIGPYGYMQPQLEQDMFINRRKSHDSWLNLALAAIAGAIGFKYKDKILESIPGTGAHKAKEEAAKAAAKAAEEAKNGKKFWTIAKKVGKYGGIAVGGLLGVFLVLKLAGGFLKGRAQRQQVAPQGMPQDAAQVEQPPVQQPQTAEPQQVATQAQPEVPQQPAA